MTCQKPLQYGQPDIDKALLLKTLGTSGVRLWVLQEGLGLRGLGVQGSGFRVLGFGFRGLGFRV